MIRDIPDWLTSGAFAHRGLHSADAAENSPSAAREAIAAGYGIECDIQMSRDNVPLVFHDWELDRLTREHGAVAERPARDLCQIGLSKGPDTIWRLGDLLEVAAGTTPLLIEVKSHPGFDIERACESVARVIAGYSGPLAVMSFDYRAGEWFARNQPQTLRGLVATDTLDHGFKNAWRAPFAIDRSAPDFLAMDVRDLPNAIARLWRESGRPLLTWTVRTRELREVAAQYADANIAEAEGLA